MEIRKEQFLAALMAFGIGTAGCKKDDRVTIQVQPLRPGRVSRPAAD